MNELRQNENLEKKESAKLANVTYESISLSDYLTRIRSAEYKVPLFQREFVWTKKMIIDFLNAIFKGYPFGNIVVWVSKDDDTLQERNDFVSQLRKENGGGTQIDSTRWILDGQQRTTSIISQLVNIDNFHRNKNIIFSLDEMKFKQHDSKKDINWVPTNVLLSTEINAIDIMEKYGIEINEAVSITDKLRKRMLETKIGVTKVENADLNVAIDIFSEMNTTGKRLSLFDIIHSKWQSSEINYNLESFIEDWYKKAGVIYRPDMLTIVKAMYLVFDKSNVSSSDILKYKIAPDHIKFVDDKFSRTLDLAHDFLINIMKFKPELIPSSNLIKFLVYAYAKNGNHQLNEKQIAKLKKYVAFVCLENYYSSATDQKVAKNLEIIDQILNGKDLPQKVTEMKVDAGDILKTEYGDGSSKYLFILNTLFNSARSLKTDQQIPVVSVAKGASKINIHHIVPKAIKINGVKISDITFGNSLANLAPILEEENLKISNKFPSEYYCEFKNENEKIDKTLEDMIISHKYLSMINSNVNTDVLSNFWTSRAETIATILNKVFRD